MMAESSAEFGLDDRETSVGRRTANLGTEIGYRVVFFFRSIFFRRRRLRAPGLTEFRSDLGKGKCVDLGGGGGGRSVGRSVGHRLITRKIIESKSRLGP